jgi:hypothetical protein
MYIYLIYITPAEAVLDEGGVAAARQVNHIADPKEHAQPALQPLIEP